MIKKRKNVQTEFRQKKIGAVISTLMRHFATGGGSFC